MKNSDLIQHREAETGSSSPTVKSSAASALRPDVLVLDAGSGLATLTVPGGGFLLTADYVRLGPDLLLVGSDGRQVLIRDYFTLGADAPDLVTEGGARIAAKLAGGLAGPVAPGEFAQAAAGAA